MQGPHNPLLNAILGPPRIAFFSMSGMVIVWRGASPRTRRVERKR